MPDITMCDGKDCPKAERCYRHTAKPDGDYQSWFEEAPVKPNGQCEHYLPVTKSG